MKVGILTFHDAHNYGAVLQAYALKKYIKQLGYDVNVINYHHKTIPDGFPRENNEIRWEKFNKFIKELTNGEQTVYTCEEDLEKVMEFYDYIEVQPPSNYSHLVARHDINTKEEVIYAINKIINCARRIGKLVVATSDCHTLNKEDKIYREIIVHQNVPGKGRHPLARYLSTEGYNTIPDQ